MARARSPRARSVHPIGFGKGAFTGYGDYRDGTSRPVSLAGTPIASALSRAERAAMVTRVVELVREWDKTPFEHEGAIRSGLRSGLCLKGNGWSSSDQEAWKITQAAFHEIGAKRPTWDQGQPEHTIAKENCGWCAGELPIDLMPSGYARSYCSKECASFAINHRNLSVATGSHDAYRAARRVIEKRRLPPMPCAQCSKPFHQRWGTEQFCSTTCAGEARRIYEARPCKCCGKQFRPTKPRETYFCSDACYRASGPTKTYDRKCVSCGEAFTARSPMAKTCSKPCQHLQTGWQPLSISRAVFDCFVSAPWDRIWERRLTPDGFDWIAMETGRTITGVATLPVPRITDHLFA